MSGAQEIVLANRLDEIPRLVEWLEEFCAAHQFPPGIGFHLTLALDEIVTNVIAYAYEQGTDRTILVRLALDGGADGDIVSAEVIDEGKAYDPTAVPDPDITLDVEDRPIGGLGIFFVRQMMDTVEYNRDGRFNRLRIAKRICADDAGRTPE